MLEPDKYVQYNYKSDRLVYGFFLNLEASVLGASADFEAPFNYACIAEVSAEFDRITIETEPEYYGDDEILVCRKDYPHQKNVATLKIKKWRNGELSFWMSRDIKTEAESKKVNKWLLRTQNSWHLLRTLRGVKVANYFGPQSQALCSKSEIN